MLFGCIVGMCRLVSVLLDLGVIILVVSRLVTLVFGLVTI